MFFPNTPEKRALKFIDSNGPALAQHIAYNVANSINEGQDTTWEIFTELNQQRHVWHEDDASSICLYSFMAIRIELQMRAGYNRFGSTVCKRLATQVGNH